MRDSLDAVPHSYSAIFPLTSTCIQIYLLISIKIHLFYSSWHSAAAPLNMSYALALKALALVCNNIFLNKTQRTSTCLVLSNPSSRFPRWILVHPYRLWTGVWSPPKISSHSLLTWTEFLGFASTSKEISDLGFGTCADNLITSAFSRARGSRYTVIFFRALWWCRPLSWEYKERLREWIQWGSALDMCAMPDDCGYTFQHPVGHKSRYYRACLIWRVGGHTELVHPPSSFQALTAAAAPGFFAQLWPHTLEIF